MKRTILVLLTILFSALLVSGVHAQSSRDLIVLDDATPGVDIVINAQPETSGVVALEIENASVVVIDAVGNIIFEASNPDIEGIEFSLSPNAGTHTITIERLPGAMEAYARINAQESMTPVEVASVLVEDNVLEIAQEADFKLNAVTPSTTVSLIVPQDTNATITASFPGMPVTAQFVDLDENRPLATLWGSLIDGVRLKVDEGAYEMVLLSNNVSREAIANVNIMTAPETDFDEAVAQLVSENPDAVVPTTLTTDNPPVTTSVSSSSVACTVTIAVSSVNIRSGPGTGYSILDYAYRDEMLPVGGVNPASGWLLVGTEGGSGWMVNTIGQLGGDCSNLPVYDIPYREAPAPQIVIQPAAAVAAPQVSVPSSTSYDDSYDDDDYDDDDHHEDEHEDEHEEEHEEDDD